MAATVAARASFGDDLAFLRKHSEVVVLSDAAGMGRVVVAPAYQGRVMTSTATGDAGASFGFLQREVIEKGERAPHITVFGGEERFWLGPEAGQYGLYFAPGAPFDFAHWQVPEALDWGAWDVTAQSPSAITLQRAMQLSNYAGTGFTLEVERTVKLLAREEVAAALALDLPPSAALVAYESRNTIRNTGSAAWVKQTGLVSIWLLGMFEPSPHTTIVIPFKPGPENALGPIVNDAYFGKVPPDRLRIDEGVLFFRGDGEQRGKIGIPGPRARSTVGAYDAQAQVLTLLQLSLDEHTTDYVSSLWQEQSAPYAGDVVNSYNDGPPEPGAKSLGPFFELESSSRAAALAPGETLTHVQRTVHITGSRAQLDAIAQRTLGVNLERIEQAFSH